ncbi:cupin domain-containing protein [Bacteroidota bacterium]
MTTDQFPKNKVLSMDQEVQYADNSIVSRQVIKDASGNISLFAFDKGQELSEHTAPFDALVQILDGRAEIFIAGEKNILGSGSSIIMPANIPHALKAVERFKMLLTMIKKVA